MENDIPPQCPACQGSGNFLGKLGCYQLWFRCRQCGIDFTISINPEDEDELDDDYEESESEDDCEYEVN